MEQREVERRAAHQQRREQLLEAQQPFGFEERAAERRARRQLLQGSVSPGVLDSVGARPGTPTFHAKPVPVSTVEVRLQQSSGLGCIWSVPLGRNWSALSQVRMKVPYSLPLPLQARYALLAAELQLHHRTVKGRGLASPPCRPATAAAAVGLRSPKPAAGSPWAADQPCRPLTCASGSRWSGLSTMDSLSGAHSAGAGAGCVQAAAAGVEPPAAAAELLPACLPVQSAATTEPLPVLVEQPGGEASGYSNSFSTCDSSTAVDAVAAESIAAAADQPGGAAGDSGEAPPVEQQQGATPPLAARCQTASVEVVALADALPAVAPSPLEHSHVSQSVKLAPVAAAAAVVGTTHSQQLKEQSLQYRLDAGQYDTAAQRAGWDAANGADVALLRKSTMQLPPFPQSSRAAAPGTACSSPVVQRLGSRASSCGGEQWHAPFCGSRSSGTGDTTEEGVAVPVHLLIAGDGPSGSSGAAGAVGTELVAYGFIDGVSSEEADRQLQPEAAKPGPGERRRDTPPQHIAARYQQAEVAARREVQQALQRRGGSIARLLEEP